MPGKWGPGTFLNCQGDLWWQGCPWAGLWRELGAFYPLELAWSRQGHVETVPTSITLIKLVYVLEVFTWHGALLLDFESQAAVLTAGLESPAGHLPSLAAPCSPQACTWPAVSLLQLRGEEVGREVREMGPRRGVALFCGAYLVSTTLGQASRLVYTTNTPCLSGPSHSFVQPPRNGEGAVGSCSEVQGGELWMLCLDRLRRPLAKTHWPHSQRHRKFLKFSILWHSGRMPSTASPLLWTSLGSSCVAGAAVSTVSWVGVGVGSPTSQQSSDSLLMSAIRPQAIECHLQMLLDLLIFIISLETHIPQSSLRYTVWVKYIISEVLMGMF